MECKHDSIEVSRATGTHHDHNIAVPISQLPHSHTITYPAVTQFRCRGCGKTLANEEVLEVLLRRTDGIKEVLLRGTTRGD